MTLEQVQRLIDTITAEDAKNMIRFICRYTGSYDAACDCYYHAILEAEETEDAPQKIRDLMSKWQAIGHVPYKEKDKIYANYKEAIDKAFEKFDMKAFRARLSNFENSISQSGSDKVYHERERLVRAFEQKSNELKTYENNMGFFTARSKDGNSIFKEMERKIANLKDEIALLEQKIKIIDEKI